MSSMNQVLQNKMSHITNLLIINTGDPLILQQLELHTGERPEMILLQGSQIFSLRVEEEKGLRNRLDQDFKFCFYFYIQNINSLVTFVT